MNFPGGHCALDMPLLATGRSGVTQVTPPEQFEPLARMSDAALIRFADEMQTLAGHDEDGNLGEYIQLLHLQCQITLADKVF
jgi:hypothetical protein